MIKGEIWINQRLFNVDSRISQLKIMIIKHTKLGSIVMGHCKVSICFT
jgi:hypothetical protein